MKRKWWAVKELFSVFGASLRLNIRAGLVWNVRVDRSIANRHERIADYEHQLSGTPLGLAQAQLDRRMYRAVLVFKWPKLDEHLLWLAKMLPDEKAQKLIAETETTLLRQLAGGRFIPDAPQPGVRP